MAGNIRERDRIHTAGLDEINGVAWNCQSKNRKIVSSGKTPLILFDVMDTLVHNPFFYELPAFFGMTHAEMVRRKHPTSWIEFESGRITEAEYFRQYFADGTCVDQNAFHACMQAAYRWVDGMEDVLSDLSGRAIDMHTLSNYPVWYRAIEAKLRLSRYVKWTFVSCETGLRKPSREAYVAAADALGRSPGTCLLIDDNRDNCASAEASGMEAIRFHGADALRGELLQRGVL